MGIDPNNHRLNQNLPRSQNPCASGGATTSSASKEIVSHPMTKSKLLWENDQVSEAASCLEDSTRCLPDLNLDLKISTIDHSSSILPIVN